MPEVSSNCQLKQLNAKMTNALAKAENIHLSN